MSTEVTRQKKLWHYILALFIYYTVVIIGYILSIFDVLCDFIRDCIFGQKVPDIPKRHVVITGCDSGFGYAGALTLAKLGLTVHSGCYTQAGIDTLEKDDRTLSLDGKIRPFRLDITSEESVNAAQETVSNLLPAEGLWALINNAGYLGVVAPDEYQTLEDYRNIWEINCGGHIRMVHAFRPLINEDNGGRIINTISLYGHSPISMIAPYASAKHAMMGYTSTLRCELWDTNIDVISVSPGLVMVTNLSANYGKIAEQRYVKLQAEGKIDYNWGFFKKRHKYMKSFTDIMDYVNTVQEVADTYAIAVTAKYPRQHYYACFDGYYARHYTATSFRVQNWIHYGIRRIAGDVLWKNEKLFRSRKLANTNHHY